MKPVEFKLLFSGPMGAGKTTAISTISDIPPVSTEARNTDLERHGKTHTTVAMDYGEIALPGGEQLRLYGMPGQERFDFMWKISSKGALGVVLLADNSRPDPLADLAPYIEAFADLAQSAAMVIGINRSNEGTTTLNDYLDWLERRDLRLPVFSVDVRQRDDVLLLLDALLSQIEAHNLLKTFSTSTA